MKVLKESKENTYKDMYTENYEFRLCGGSVEPADRKDAVEGEALNAEEIEKN